jgi:hypothetical protein
MAITATKWPIAKILKLRYLQGDEGVPPGQLFTDDGERLGDGVQQPGVRRGNR